SNWASRLNRIRGSVRSGRFFFLSFGFRFLAGLMRIGTAGDGTNRERRCQRVRRARRYPGAPFKL
ncbi:MAG: hypothetical protein N2556_04660, partial [Anaerolineae bacterium]|nr:hypothetical protein [Anaerolineae bacterium]